MEHSGRIMDDDEIEELYALSQAVPRKRTNLLWVFLGCGLFWGLVGAFLYWSFR